MHPHTQAENHRHGHADKHPPTYFNRIYFQSVSAGKWEQMSDPSSPNSKTILGALCSLFSAETKVWGQSRRMFLDGWCSSTDIKTALLFVYNSNISWLEICNTFYIAPVCKIGDDEITKRLKFTIFGSLRIKENDYSKWQYEFIVDKTKQPHSKGGINMETAWKTNQEKGPASLQHQYLHAKGIIHQIALRTLLWLPH